jgi:integration host factor subunit beta
MGGIMTKADLVEQVAEAIGPGITKKDCALVVDGLLNAVKAALADHDNIEIRGFGTFKVRQRKARVARNPRTGERVEVPARTVPVFKPSKDLREQVMEAGDAVASG